MIRSRANRPLAALHDELMTEVGSNALLGASEIVLGKLIEQAREGGVRQGAAQASCACSEVRRA